MGRGMFGSATPPTQPPSHPPDRPQPPSTQPSYNRTIQQQQQQLQQQQRQQQQQQQQQSKKEFLEVNSNHLFSVFEIKIGLIGTRLIISTCLKCPLEMVNPVCSVHMHMLVSCY